GDLRRRELRFARPACVLADVDEADRLSAAALFRDVAQELRLLRAGDDHVATDALRIRGELLLAEHRAHRGLRRQLERARERSAIERHGPVAAAEVEFLVGDAHFGGSADASASPSALSSRAGASDGDSGVTVLEAASSGA